MLVGKWTKPKLQTKLNQWLLKRPHCALTRVQNVSFFVSVLSLYQIQDGGGPSSCHPRPLRRGDTLFTKVDAAHTDPPAGLNLPWPLLPL